MENDKTEYWKQIYSNPDNLVEIKFANPTDSLKTVWLEPVGDWIKLDPYTEYKIVTHDRKFTIEYTSAHEFTFWLENAFGCILYKRAIKAPQNDWELVFDL